MVGYGFARQGNIPAHQYNQTAWVLFNIVLTIFIMVVAFSRHLLDRGLTRSYLCLDPADAATYSIWSKLGYGVVQDTVDIDYDSA